MYLLVNSLAADMTAC